MRDYDIQVVYFARKRRALLKRLYKNDAIWNINHSFKIGDGEIIHHWACNCWICYYKLESHESLATGSKWQPPQFIVAKYAGEIQFFK